MLCACSGEQFRFEEAPPSPESLATRDYSACGFSSRTGDWDPQVDDVESALKETVSLNYEEARALLGRLEFQRGNLDAALHVFRGIDVAGIKSKMVNALVERSLPRKSRSRGSIMSMHSVNLLLEAILLKSKALSGLRSIKEAAAECGAIVDIAEAAFPDGMAAGMDEDCRLQELLHEALLLLPEMWKVAGVDLHAVDSYRRVLSRPWNLPPPKLAAVQKSLATLLLHGGEELADVEDALRLLLILSEKMAAEEITFDLDVVDHLCFALSLCGKSENVAKLVEMAPPGIYDRRERWYILALCYSAAGEGAAALNLLRKVAGPSERRREAHLPSLLLAAKICSRSRELTGEGIFFSRMAVQSAAGRQCRRLLGVASHLLAISCSGAARSCASDSERSSFYEQSEKALANSMAADGDNPEAMLTLARESAMRRNQAPALAAAAKYIDLAAGSSVRGWELLAHVAASEGNFKHAEDIIDFALEETDQVDQLNLLRMKGALRNLQEDQRQAIDTYRLLLTLIETKSQTQTEYCSSKEVAGLEMDMWLELAAIYRDLGSWSDSEICLNKARVISSFSPRCWHARGKLLQAKGLNGEALAAFLVSSSVDPDQAAPSMAAMAALLAGLGPTARPAARSLLMNALRLDPMSHAAWLGLGHVYKMEGSLLQAADCFQVAHELLASSPLEGFL